MKPHNVFSPAQTRAARALLRWPPERLADAARLEPEALELFETGEAHLSERELGQIGTALNIAGVIAVQAGLAGAGVRFRRPSTSPEARWVPWLGPD